MRVAHREIPELVLQHDGHFFRVLLAHARGELHAGRARVERDVEMMLARQRAGLGHIGQHAAHHRAQRLLGQEIVADVVDGHRICTVTSGANAKPIRFRPGLSPPAKRSGGFCCQVPPNPACRSLSRQDFKYRYYKPLTRPALPEHSCRWQLWIGPSRRNHLGQKHVLYALVDPVSAPPVQRPSPAFREDRPHRDGVCDARAAPVEPPGTAPGSDRFITTPVYRHSRPLRDGTLNIGGQGLRRKGRDVSRETFPVDGLCS